jgi:hypothetical protein
LLFNGSNAVLVDVAGESVEEYKLVVDRIFGVVVVVADGDGVPLRHDIIDDGN